MDHLSYRVSLVCNKSTLIEEELTENTYDVLVFFINRVNVKKLVIIIALIFKVCVKFYIFCLTLRM